MKNLIEYDKVVKKMKREEIEEFLIRNLINDIHLGEKLQIEFPQYFTKKTKEELKRIIRNSLTKVADRGYIDEEMGREAMYILYEYKCNVEECAKKNNIEDAFELLEAVLEVLGEFAIDGSYGEHEMIQEEFKEMMEILLSQSTSKQKEKFYKWLKEYIDIEDEFIDFKHEFTKVIK